MRKPTERRCEDCKRFRLVSEPLPAWLSDPRLCTPLPAAIFRSVTVMRAEHGECGPDGKLWQPREVGHA